MPMNFAKLEQTVFRSLNTLVEPMVRKGVGSPRYTPASLIVLETTGFKSGKQRRTPLWSVKLGPYRVVSTARGNRSFWVKNLRKHARVNYYLGGRQHSSEALLIPPGQPLPKLKASTPFLKKIVDLLSRHAPEGWAFAILVKQ